MLKSYGRSLLLLTIWGTGLFWAHAAQASDRAVKCQPLALAEYCFPGGSFHDLVPLDRLETQFNEKARELKAKRNKPSALPAWRKQELEDMWLAALSSAFDYADKHSLKLEHLSAVSPQDATGSGSQPSALLNDGPLLRLTFREEKKNVFRLDGSIQIHYDRTFGKPLVNGKDLPSELQPFLLMLPVLGSSVPRNGDYVDLDDILATPFLKPFADQYARASKKSGTNFLGSLGYEVVAALEMAFEEKIRDRNRTLEHAIHFYASDEDPASTTRSPQVLFTGELLLPDSMVAALSDTELMLLMFHEAMHLARPNLFMLLSAADLIQRESFPDLDTAQSAPFLANLLGQEARGKDANCPLDIVHDDELATDYYVFHLFRRKPELAQAYNAFLKRLHSEFDPGRVSPMSYRVQLGDYMIGYLEDGAWTSKNSQLEDKLFWESFMSTLSSRGLSYLMGEQIRIEHFLQEMAKHPELKHSVSMMRTFIEYYKNNAFLNEKAVTHTGSNLTCRDVVLMLRTDE
ncbi:hypothetical protein WNZ15_24010 [Roseibium sp. AS2]|uniref:hypothetical protein n=1 Tax=Roseibium sp. AS2 TaxID=3135781 RepID=UPI00316BF0A2